MSQISYVNSTLLADLLRVSKSGIGTSLVMSRSAPLRDLAVGCADVMAAGSEQQFLHDPVFLIPSEVEAAPASERGVLQARPVPWVAQYLSPQNFQL